MVADEVLLELIHAELVSYAYSKAESSIEKDKKVTFLYSLKNKGSGQLLSVINI